MRAPKGAVAALALLAACPSPAPEPVRPGPGPGSAIAPAPADASQDEQLAAIQKAMNELDEAAQGCWAAAAVERFDIEGELTARIDIGGGGTGATVVGLVQDTTRTPRLASCVIAVLTNYPWAPPLRGQSIQLPFKFRAPDDQNVIDRALVPWNGQAGISVAVLLDLNNSANEAASMLEVAIDVNKTTGIRQPDRGELWYFLTPARFLSASGERSVGAGDMLFAPKGSIRGVRADVGAPSRAVVVVVPGGAEGSARAGALPAPAVGSPSPTTYARHLPAASAKTYGPATIYLEPAIVKDAPLSASILSMKAGASVPEHVHANETEMLYILEGTGTMTVKGVAQAVTATSVIQIPANTKHAVTATSAIRALQIYTPAGPEQRFKGTP